MVKSREGGFQPDRSSFQKQGTPELTPDQRAAALREAAQENAINLQKAKSKEPAHLRTLRAPTKVETGGEVDKGREQARYARELAAMRLEGTLPGYEGLPDSALNASSPETTLDLKARAEADKLQALAESRIRQDKMAADSQKAAEILAELEALDAAEYTPIGTGEFAGQYRETPLVQPGKPKEGERKDKNERQQSA